MSLFKTNTNELKAELDALTASNLTLETEHATLIETLKDKEATVADLTLQLADLNESVASTTLSNTDLTAQVATLEASQTDFDTKLAEATARAIAETGHTPIEETPEDKSGINLIEQFKALKGKEAAEFYENHKNEL